MTLWRWLATFLAVVGGGASILLAAWGIWLIVAPHEEIHFEYAIPALALAVLGAASAVALWRHGAYTPAWPFAQGLGA